MKYKKVRLNLSKLNYAALVELGKRVNSYMTGNANFPTPPAALAATLVKTNALSTSLTNAKATNSKQDWADCRTYKAELISNLRVLASYVDEIANGVESIVLSAGMAVNKNREKSPAAEQVNNVVAEFTGVTGTIKLLWATARYARLYDVYMTSTPAQESSWVLLNSVIGRKLLVSNLATGTRYWFKVVAKGVNGNAAPSEPADQIAA